MRDLFNGKVTVERLGIVGAVAGDVQVSRVAFEPGVHTRWHSHAGGQILVVEKGSCDYQERGGPQQTLTSGSVIAVDRGVWHWHGASMDGPMTHLAVNGPNVEGEIEWGDSPQVAGPTSRHE